MSEEKDKVIIEMELDKDDFETLEELKKELENDPNVSDVKETYCIQYTEKKIDESGKVKEFTNLICLDPVVIRRHIMGGWGVRRFPRRKIPRRRWR